MTMLELTRHVGPELELWYHVGKRVYRRLDQRRHSTFCHILRCSVV
jgi:hypothetical protein